MMRTSGLFALAAVLLFAARARVAEAQEAHWTQTSGPVTGYVHDLAAHAGGPVYAIAGQHVYRSDNDARTWVRTAYRRQSPYRLTVSTEGYLFVSSSCPVPVSVESATDFERCGSYRSLDEGATWEFTGEVGTFAAGASGVVFGRTSSQLVRSEDGGATWAQVDLAAVHPDTTSPAVSALAANGATVAADTRDAVFVSTDNGATWRRVPFETELRPRGQLVVLDTETLFSHDYADVLRSQDGGASWYSVLPAATVQTVHDVWTDAEAVVYAATDRGLYRSDDAGGTWQVVGSNDLPTTVITRTPAGTLLVGGDLGVYRLGTDETWHPSADGIIETEIGGLTVASDGAVWAGTNRDGLFRTTDGGDTWRRFVLPWRVEALAAGLDGSVYAGTIHTPGLFRLRADTDTAEALGLRPVDGVAVLPDGTLFARESHVVYHGLHRSRDGGETWASMWDEDRRIGAMAVGGDGIVYVMSEGLQRSADGGDSWETLGLGDVSVSALAVSARGYLFAGVEGRILRSADEGASWDEVYSQEWSTSIRSFAVSPGPVVFAVTSDEVLRSLDDGATWHTFSSGLPMRSAPEYLERLGPLAIGGDGYVYVGTHGDGVLRTTAPVATSAEPRADGLHSLRLGSSYPNPFTRSTSIPFALPEPADVSLIVYDVLGREVARLVDGRLGAGQHRVTWRAEGLAAGVYSCRLVAGTSTASGTLVLVR